MTLISVIIPTRTDDLLTRLLSSITEDVKVFIIDDGLAFVHSEGTTISGIKPFCFARNINLGIKQALELDPTTDIVILNDDTRIGSENFFKSLQEAAYSDDTIGLVSPKIKGSVGNPNQDIYHVNGVLYNETKITLAFVGVFIKNATLKKVGVVKHSFEYLDERFTGYGYEDNDYCDRCREAGLKTVITSKAVLEHLGTQSFIKYLKNGDFTKAVLKSRDEYQAKKGL